MASSRVRGVSFDFGDTIVGLDAHLLFEKLQRCGLYADEARLEAAIAPARRAYDEAVARGAANHPWKPFMQALLSYANAEPRAEIDRAVDELWLGQPRQNLWRKPVSGMFEVLGKLKAADVPLGILTNSEGKAAALVKELGLDRIVSVVIDSGVIGRAKPDPAIFHAFAAALGLPPAEIVHVGDSLAADVRGALSVGMQAIWFTELQTAAPVGVTVCRNAAELQRAFVSCGLLPS